SCSDCSGASRDLPSFPTRRSSDLAVPEERAQHQVPDRTDLGQRVPDLLQSGEIDRDAAGVAPDLGGDLGGALAVAPGHDHLLAPDRKSTRLNSSHVKISYAVFCLK